MLSLGTCSAFLCEFLPLLEATIACLVPHVPQGTNHADSCVFRFHLARKIDELSCHLFGGSI
jgi:hypothetical protein